MTLLEAWLSGKTVRCHTMQKLRHDNVAEHTWGVLMLAIKYLPENRAVFLEYLTVHDMGERAVGDVPAHVLWGNPELQGALHAKEVGHTQGVMSAPQAYEHPEDYLTEEEKVCAEVLDRAEFVLGCIYEVKQGNTLVRQPMARGMAKITQTLRTLPDGRTKDALRYLLQDLTKLTGETSYE